MYGYDLKMEFPIEQYAMLIIVCGKRPNKEKLDSFEKMKTYKYLGIME